MIVLIIHSESRLLITVLILIPASGLAFVHHVSRIAHGVARISSVVFSDQRV